MRAWARRNRNVNSLPDLAATPTATTPAADGIAVVVVTFQSASTIQDCLQRLRTASGVVEIRVVDNASTDGTLALVQRHAVADRRIRFIANPDNPGFGVGCNQGAADSTAPWIALVNPDLLVGTDALSRLRNHARGVDPALLGADLVDVAGERDAAARRSDPVFARMLHRPSAARLGVPPDEALAVQPVEAVSGALMLLPRVLWDRLQGFDPGYRLHAEDLDLCRRARGLGATVAVANDVRVVHVRGVSSRSNPMFVEWHKHRGLWRYFQKFEARQSNPLVRGGVWTMIWARYALQVVRRTLR